MAELVADVQEADRVMAELNWLTEGIRRRPRGCGRRCPFARRQGAAREPTHVADFRGKGHGDQEPRIA